MRRQTFYGWHVVSAAFVLAVFGWGLGFYGPPIFLHAVQEQRGWPLPLVSAAVTVHFLSGAALVAMLPALYRRYGLPAVTKIGAVCLPLGVFGWAAAVEPWQLFAATVVSGIGWAAMGSAAVNEIVSPWFVRGRPTALSMAYNGASVGGVIFSPLWAGAIGWFGFAPAAAVIGVIIAGATWILATRVFARTPPAMGLAPDGDTPAGPVAAAAAPAHPALPGAQLWRDVKFVTLSAGMSLGLFAQIGLIAHLYSLLVPALGEEPAGLAMGLATAMSILARTLVAWWMPPAIDRRVVACVCYAGQIAGSLVFLLAGGSNAPLLLLAVILFGAGIGNATSLPPLIAQLEFTPEDTRRVVALIVAISQATYAFAPVTFGFIRDVGPSASAGAAPLFFVAAALVQGLAICALLAGRRRRTVELRLAG